jgi:hypothetical protein
MHQKIDTIRGWPARLDQELRSQFGDELRPKTTFDKESRAYHTDYAGGIGSPERWPEVEQFIAGFMAAVSMVTE